MSEWQQNRAVVDLATIYREKTKSRDDACLILETEKKADAEENARWISMRSSPGTTTSAMTSATISLSGPRGNRNTVAKQQDVAERHDDEKSGDDDEAPAMWCKAATVRRNKESEWHAAKTSFETSSDSISPRSSGSAPTSPESTTSSPSTTTSNTEESGFVGAIPKTSGYASTRQESPENTPPNSQPHRRIITTTSGDNLAKSTSKRAVAIQQDGDPQDDVADEDAFGKKLARSKSQVMVTSLFDITIQKDAAQKTNSPRPIDKLSLRQLKASMRNQQKQQQRYQDNIPVSERWEAQVLSPVTYLESVDPGNIFITMQELDIQDRIGKGGYSRVYQAKWKNLIVAVKMMDTELAVDISIAHMEEIAVMKGLMHPNVVQMLGVCNDPLCIVMELMKTSLYHEIHHRDSVMPWPLRLDYLIQGAAGAAYLHRQRIIHGDIKPLNMLIDNEGVLKLTDFGLSKIQSATASLAHQTQVRGLTHTHAAPELVNTQTMGYPSDVFAFGIIFWEMHELKLPWVPRHPLFAIAKGERPLVEKDHPNFAYLPYRELMEKCWDTEPSVRPNFVEILGSLNDMRNTNFWEMPAYTSLLA